jgi:hypothetical protein
MIVDRNLRNPGCAIRGVTVHTIPAATRRARALSLCQRH